MVVSGTTGASPAVELGEVLLAERAADLAHPVGPEVEGDQPVAGPNAARLADHGRLDELVGLAALVRGLDRRRGGRRVQARARGRSRRRRAWSGPSAGRGPCPSSGPPSVAIRARVPRPRASASHCLRLLDVAGRRSSARVSRPSVSACSTSSGTRSRTASSMQARRWSRLEWTPPSDTSPIRCRRPPPSRAARQALPQRLVLEEAAVRDRVVDADQVLLDDRARAEVQVPDLRVAHLAVGQADRAPGGLQLRVRIALPERVEHRRVRQRDGVAGARRREAPAVEHDQRHRRDRAPGAHRACRSGRDDLRRTPPGRGSRRRPVRRPRRAGPSSSAALDALTLPP